MEKDTFSRHDLGSSGTSGKRGVLVLEQKEKGFEEVRRKESAKEIGDIFGDATDASRCSKNGLRNLEDKNGPRIIANGRENLEAGIPIPIPMTSRIAQNLTTPRGHGRRDGETKQVKKDKRQKDKKTKKSKRQKDKKTKRQKDKRQTQYGNPTRTWQAGR